MADDDTLVQRLGGDDDEQKRRGRAFLTVLSGREVGTVHKLGPGESVIGRGAEADVQVVDDGVSRRHAKVVRDLDGTAKVVDLKSTNGTYVNGRRVEVESLREGDRIRIGQSATLDFRYEYYASSDGDVPVQVPPTEPGATRPGGFDNLAGALDSLGRVYKSSRQYEQALKAYERTLAIREESFGPTHPAVAAILDTMAAVLRAKGDFEQALGYQQRAMSIYEERVGDGPLPPEMAHLLTNLGECELGLRRPDEALRTFERALEMLRSRGAEDSELAAARFGIARTLVLLGRDNRRAHLLARQAREGFAEATGGRQKMVEVERWLDDGGPATES